MKRRIVDTNVAVVANGRDSNAALNCRLAAIDALASLLRAGQIIIDDDGEMLGEYKTYCSPKGEPGIGDRFFREVLTNYSGKILRIRLDRNEDGSYVDFPNDPDLATFDRSDRKFAAAARKASAPVLNATDEDWWEHRVSLSRNGIRIEFVCGANKNEWFAD